MNEVEAMARKATRGAGYPWGLAEEASKATRWLCLHELDGCASLLRVLQRFDSVEKADVMPRRDGHVWTCDAGQMCPISAGAALSDHCALFKDQPQELLQVFEPIFLLPFAAHAARTMKSPRQLQCAKGVAATDGHRLAVHVNPGSDPCDVVFEPAAGVDLEDRTNLRATPEPDVWVLLNRFAQRTYAPATEASRLKGAGAGVSDND